MIIKTMLMLIYLLSILILYLILKEDIIKVGYKPTLKNLYNYYKFDIIWILFPIINTCIIFIWVFIRLKKN